MMCYERRWNMDESEARRLVTTYSNLILRISYTYLKSTYEAEDVCQNVFLKYMDDKTEFLDEKHEKAWIIRTTINTCKNVLKSAYHKKVVIMDNVLGDTVKEELYPEVREQVLLLPKNYRIAIYLFYFEGYNVKEIAAAMGKSENAVTLYLSRGRKKLKGLLKDYGKGRMAHYE